jgi:hypothetical protein
VKERKIDIFHKQRKKLSTVVLENSPKIYEITAAIPCHIDYIKTKVSRRYLER